MSGYVSCAKLNTEVQALEDKIDQATDPVALAQAIGDSVAATTAIAEGIAGNSTAVSTIGAAVAGDPAFVAELGASLASDPTATVAALGNDGTTVLFRGFSV